jgi:acetoin utilization deacetylase AcuC-like enzyme
MATLLFTDPICLAHDPGPRHSESPQRLTSILSALDSLPEGARIVTSNRAARFEDLIAAHDAGYVNHLLSLRGASGFIDFETPIGPQSIDAALHAAGAGLTLVDALIDGAARRGMALVRPPGHHAFRDRGGGFCVFNNIAVACFHALRRGVSRVLIVDWDVHHGNGTQAIFYDRRDVFFFDVHQEGLYPDSGSADERGLGEGLHYTRNLPLMPLSSDDEYLRAIDAELAPIAESYRPELILVSCGFDALDGDPEGGMALSANGFARLTTLTTALAERFCAGRIGLFLEGGYHRSELAQCVRTTALALHAAPWNG